MATDITEESKKRAGLFKGEWEQKIQGKLGRENQKGWSRAARELGYKNVDSDKKIKNVVDWYNEYSDSWNKPPAAETPPPVETPPAQETPPAATPPAQETPPPAQEAPPADDTLRPAVEPDQPMEHPTRRHHHHGHRPGSKQPSVPTTASPASQSELDENAAGFKNRWGIDGGQFKQEWGINAQDFKNKWVSGLTGGFNEAPSAQQQAASNNAAAITAQDMTPTQEQGFDTEKWGYHAGSNPYTKAQYADHDSNVQKRVAGLDYSTQQDRNYWAAKADVTRAGTFGDVWKMPAPNWNRPEDPEEIKTTWQDRTDSNDDKDDNKSSSSSNKGSSALIGGFAGSVAGSVGASFF